MARFFLHLQNDDSLLTDDDGADFTSLASACAQARKTIGDVLADEIDRKTGLIHLTMKIHDDTGARVATVQAVTNITETCDPFVAE